MKKWIAFVTALILLITLTGFEACYANEEAINPFGGSIEIPTFRGFQIGQHIYQVYLIEQHRGMEMHVLCRQQNDSELTPWDVAENEFLWIWTDNAELFGYNGRLIYQTSTDKVLNNIRYAY